MNSEKLTSFQQIGNRGVMFESLELSVWAQIRVGVIEADDKADSDQRFVLVQMVEKGTAVGVNVQRPPDGMVDLAWVVLSRVDFPNFLENEDIFLSFYDQEL